MSDGINIRVSGQLRAYIETQIGENGFYESVSEYIRSLIRADYERSEQKKWHSLYQELESGILMNESAFINCSAEEIKRLGRQEKQQ
jgi:antitoxin ParD1/3/4